MALTLRFGLALLVVAMTCVAAPLNAQPGFSQLNPERLWDMARVGEPVLSPDGRWVVFTLARSPRGLAGPSVDLWLMESNGKSAPRQLTRNPGPDFDPSWSPDSRKILYASQRGDDPPQIYLLDLGGGEPQPLTRFPSGATHPAWRRGTDTVIFEALTYPDIGDNFEALTIRIQADRRRRAVAFGSDSRLFRIGGRAISEGQVMHLFEYDPATQVVRDLMKDFQSSVAISDLRWDLSADGSLLAFSANVAPPPYPRINRDVFIKDLNTGAVRAITAGNPADDFSPVFSPKGDFLVYGRRKTPDSLVEFTELMRYSLRTGDTRSLTDSRQLSPESWQIGEAGKRIYFNAEALGRRHVYRIGSGGGKPRIIVEGGTVDGLDLGPDNQLVYRAQSMLQPPHIVRADDDGLHPEQLTFFNRAFLDATRFGSVDEFRIRGYRNEPVHGFLLTPPGFSESRAWPLLVVLHGGPHSAWLDAFGFRWNLAMMTTPGYVVAAINVHGSTGYGADFAESVVGDPVNPAADDVIATVEQLAARPWIDGDRVAVMGASYGGYLTSWLLTRTQRFAAAVVHAGVFDLVSQYASDYPWGREHTYGATPWEDPQSLASFSPSYRADRITTPVLLLHGEKDFRVPMHHSLMMHNVLTGRGVPSRIVLFPESGHGIDDRDAAEAWWSEVFDWLGRYLAAP